MRRRNVLFLSILLIALSATLLLPTTGWLARLELKCAIALFNPVAMSGDALSKRSKEIAAGNPQDFDLAYAAALRQTGSAMNETNTAATEGSGERIPEKLEALKTQFPNQPELYAHQLRYWTLGPMLLNHRDPEKPRPLNARQNRADIWVRAENAADTGARFAPDNAYFPLMKAIALFAQNCDPEAYAALHIAANCARYDDYIWQEATSFWKLSNAMNGETGSVAKMAQMAAILFPHYTPIRTAAKMAAAEATRREKAGDITGAVQIRHDLAVIGSRMRNDGKSLITNLVGIAIFHLAAKGSPGWVELETRGQSDAEREKQIAARAQRYADYLKSVGAKNEARFYEIESYTSLETKRLVHRGTGDNISGWNGLLFGTIKTGIAQVTGVLLLINLGWILLLGAGAVLLCHTRGIRTGEGLPLLAHVFLWATIGGTGIAMAYLQPQGMNPAQNLINMIAATGNNSSNSWSFLTMVALSYSIPLLVLLVLAIRGKIKRERVVVAVARGMRVVALPVAAVLSLLFVGQVFWTAGIEKENLAWIQGMAQNGELQRYAHQVGAEWPIVVQR